MTARIDAHQHFWSVIRGDYGWLTPEKATLFRDFDPADLLPLLEEPGIDATVLVQAAQTVEETHFLLGIAEKTDWVAGVVGWTDFEAISAADDIARLAEHPKLVGLRPMIQDLPDDDWMLLPALEPALAAMVEAELVFDALVLPRHLDNLHALLCRNPELRVVIDHCAKPRIRGGAFQPWAADMERLARDTGALCKISGLVTEAAANWRVDDLRPYVDHVLEHFGPRRVIWGSDWPVATLVASYADWLHAAEELAAAWPPADRAAFFGGNAVRLYGLDRDGRLPAQEPVAERRAEA